MLEETYAKLCKTDSDINTHLPTIRKYVAEGDLVVEMGVRDCVSTWALMVNKPKQLVSVDVCEPSQENLEAVVEAAKTNNINFTFILGSSLEGVFGTQVDVLFIDTVHTYSQLVKELFRHSEDVKKYIILHDTNIPEMWSCVTDFLYNPHWKLEEQNPSKTGLSVLKRV